MFVSTLNTLSRAAYAALFVGGSVAGGASLVAGGALAAPSCPVERAEPLAAADDALCDQLEEAVRKPGALPHDQYEAKLSAFLRNFCHRPNRAEGDEDKTETPVPDGAIMVKEMFPPPTSHCKDAELVHLFPENGGAIMVRASKESRDGWFWGWFGWGEGDWAPTWPATSAHGYPNTGFGLYCTNCHSSARDNQTFASLRNVKGEPGEPLVFLGHDFYLEDHFQNDSTRMGQRRGAPPPQPKFATLHEQVATEEDDVKSAISAFNRRLRSRKAYSDDFSEIFQLLSGAPAPEGEPPTMPSQTYDHVWFPAGEPTAKSRFVTSDQCLGCHSAGGTGLQFHMTEQGQEPKQTNISPYGSWRKSPMGLAGRDPIFFVQLASEIETFHPESKSLIEDTPA